MRLKEFRVTGAVSIIFKQPSAVSLQLYIEIGLCAGAGNWVIILLKQVHCVIGIHFASLQVYLRIKCACLHVSVKNSYTLSL